MLEAARFRARIVLALCVLLAGMTIPSVPEAADRPAPSDVGAFLQAGARLRAEWVGRRVVTRLALPGRSTGLVADLDRGGPPSAKDVARQTRALGKAYEAGDTLVIRDVRVSHREIAVIFGAGGYSEDDAVAFTPLRPSPIEEAMLAASARAWSNAQLSSATVPGGTSSAALDAARARRDRAELAARGNAQGREMSELSRVQERRHTLSRTWGARVRLVSKRDLPLEDFDPAVVRERLGPYLGFLD